MSEVVYVLRAFDQSEVEVTDAEVATLLTAAEVRRLWALDPDDPAIDVYEVNTPHQRAGLVGYTVDWSDHYWYLYAEQPRA